jgi:hypothetical protein
MTFFTRRHQSLEVKIKAYDRANRSISSERNSRTNRSISSERNNKTVALKPQIQGIS